MQSWFLYDSWRRGDDSPEPGAEIVTPPANVSSLSLERLEAEWSGGVHTSIRK